MRPRAPLTSLLHSTDHGLPRCVQFVGFWMSVYFYASTLYVRDPYDYIFFVQGKAGGLNW